MAVTISAISQLRQVSWQASLKIKYAFPMTSAIIVLICVPFASNPRRSGIAVTFAVGATIALVYFILFRILQSAGYNEKVPEYIAVWGINALFLLIGLSLMIGARKKCRILTTKRTARSGIETVDLHYHHPRYHVEEFLEGRSSLFPLELAELPDVKNKTLLHLQCQFGQDTLSWAREGAIVTGVDISDLSISRANELKQRAGLDARFVRSDLF